MVKLCQKLKWLFLRDTMCILFCLKLRNNISLLWVLFNRPASSELPQARPCTMGKPSEMFNKFNSLFVFSNCWLDSILKMLENAWIFTNKFKALEHAWKVLEFRSSICWNFAFNYSFEANTCMHFTFTCFLPHDASAERSYEIAFVCPSVTIRYHEQIGWNSSKIISRPNSLRSMCSFTPNMGDLVQREHPQN